MLNKSWLHQQSPADNVSGIQSVMIVHSHVLAMKAMLGRLADQPANVPQTQIIFTFKTKVVLKDYIVHQQKKNLSEWVLLKDLQSPFKFVNVNLHLQ